MSNRGTNPASLKNLELGRTKGHGKGKPSNASGLTWKELIERYGQIEPDPELCKAAGLTDKVLRVMGLRRPTWKALVVARAFRETNNPSIFKELMARSEPLAQEIVIRRDWREMARDAGLDEGQVLEEVQRILDESDNSTGDQESDAEAG